MKIESEKNRVERKAGFHSNNAAERLIPAFSPPKTPEYFRLTD